MTATAANVAVMRAVIRRARHYGVRVQTVDGWRQRGRPYSFRCLPTEPRAGIVEHHDASPISSGDHGALSVVVAGRSDLPGPLAQLFFPRCLDGLPTVIVVAAGLANHAGYGGPINGVPADQGNTYLMGEEVANNGLGEPYAQALTYALIAVEAAILDVLGAPTSHLIGHKEWAPGRKTDPLISMDNRRDDVDDARQLAAAGNLTYTGADMPLTNDDVDKIVRGLLNADVTPAEPGEEGLSVRAAFRRLLAQGGRDADRDARILEALNGLPATIEAKLPTLDGGPQMSGLTRADVRQATQAALREVLEDTRLVTVPHPPPTP